MWRVCWDRASSRKTFVRMQGCNSLSSHLFKFCRGALFYVLRLIELVSCVSCVLATRFLGNKLSAWLSSRLNLLFNVSPPITDRYKYLQIDYILKFANRLPQLVLLIRRACSARYFALCHHILALGSKRQTLAWESRCDSITGSSGNFAFYIFVLYNSWLGFDSAWVAKKLLLDKLLPLPESPMS